MNARGSVKFYEINADGISEDGTAYYETLDEAKQAARELARDDDMDIVVDRVEASVLRSGIIKLASGRGWCLSRETVFVAKGRKGSKT
jgi:hypothetical protein